MKKAFSFVIILHVLFSLSSTAQVRLENLRTENADNPIGLDITHPRFSWQLVSDQRNSKQTAYEIRVGDNPHEMMKSKGTGKMVSDQSLYVPYQGETLKASKRYYWQVRVWDNAGNVSAWSTPAFFQMGLLTSSDWKAAWIVPGFEEDSLRASPLFRKAFNSAKKIKSATAYITAHGLYEAQINGKRVGDAYLTPGWTSYNKRLQYQAYDVTNLLQEGDNAIGVELGNGWYRSYIAWSGNHDSYGKDIALLFQLDITYTDGTAKSIVSDESWKSSTGAIRYSEIYHGETIDARLAKKGWATAGYHDNDWSGVKRADFSKSALVAT